MPTMSEDAKGSILRVGMGDSRGRGFVVEGAGHKRYVITAAHCLERLPPAHAASDLADRIYPAILGQLGEEPVVSAECLFVDPISDLAVLGEPDHQCAPDEWSNYQEFIKTVGVIPIADTHGKASAKVLTLNGAWADCRITASSGPIWLHDVTTESGMSGSPILNANLSAIGVLVVGRDSDLRMGSGPQPRLMRNLPGWLLAECRRAPRPRRRTKRP